MKASILAVGSEITAGQITNRNAAWISRELSQLGLQTAAHLTVADDRAAIREGLQFLEKKGELIFVTGGLGPTSDDFTRDLILEWAHLPSEFDEKSWTKICARLNERGLPIEEFQKQQCYFPKGAQVLENTQGTANAFFLKTSGHYLWALPGPPAELACVWKDHIHSQLREITKGLDLYVTKSWDILGLGEAVAPTLIEPLTAGLKADVGYRVHMPYLEIKFSFFKSQQLEMEPTIKKIEAALKNYTFFHNGETVAQELEPPLQNAPHLHVVDEVTEGLLLSRIAPLKKKNFSFSDQRGSSEISGSWQIQCLHKNEFEFELCLSKPGSETFRKIITSPLSKSAQMTERRRQYFAEMALITILGHWRTP